ncbi:cytochrome P450 [Mycena maculata]|uniref:Cytochrome P450 n=1 Tax=Mycena maculata TaxID=230809 RepID=A0AAD7JEX8_9AGAR|nr:cytochrome P450 [Mycena maculata]
MHIILHLILPLVATSGAYVLFHLAEILYCEFSYPLRGLVGPKNLSPSFPGMLKRWRARTFFYKDVFNTRELYTTDILVIDHTLKETNVYQKRVAFRARINSPLGGKGLLNVQGGEPQASETSDGEPFIAYKNEVIIYQEPQNPAFGTAQIRELTGGFLDKSVQLRDIWVEMIWGHAEPQHINMLPWLSKMTLDVIGLLGFGSQFNTLNPKAEPNPIQKALEQLFRASDAGLDSILQKAVLILPILGYLVIIQMNSHNVSEPYSLPSCCPAAKTRGGPRRQLFAAGNKLLADSKGAINAAGGPKSVSGNRDLFSLLLRVNMSLDVPDHHRMSEEEVIAQIPTFFIAGHATTSGAVTWALHALSLNLCAQSKLREELLTLDTNSPTLEQLDTLPYLESVIRETLRVYSPVAHITRLAAADDVVPLKTPCFDNKGKVYTSLPISKGQMVHIPISDVNTDPNLWGVDAAEFRPERWEQVPEAIHSIPGVWANLLTFLAGPYNCIGFRFSLAEQKALLFVLIRAFEFTEAVPRVDIGRSSSALQVPFVFSEMEKGRQMPLLVRVYQG